MVPFLQEPTSDGPTPEEHQKMKNQIRKGRRRRRRITRVHGMGNGSGGRKDKSLFLKIQEENSPTSRHNKTHDITPKHLPFFDLQKLVLFDPPTGCSRDNVAAIDRNY